MNKIIYLGYYIKQLNIAKLNQFLSYASASTGKSKVKLFLDCLISVFKYNISILEYFQFRFFMKDMDERIKWAGTGYMYEYQKKMNPPTKRIILDDKVRFYQKYKPLVKHWVFSISELRDNPDKVTEILKKGNKRLVFKVADGKCGAQVSIKNLAEFDEVDMMKYMTDNGFDLVEEYIQQHKELMNLSPTAVNTIRIFTQLNINNNVEILGCRLRISVNSEVDNMAAGNIAAPIDEKTGIVYGPGVYSDITKTDEDDHPVTGKSVIGFQVPFWKETMEMVHSAALMFPENRSIGWDIAMTENGPDLIEGNHDWCKLLWQLPVKQGLKPLLEKHLAELS